MPTIEDPQFLLPYDQIQVLPGRQRSKLDVTELKESIQRLGVLHPVIVRQDPDGNFILVAGQRRLQACTELDRLVPIRLFDTLDPIEAQIVELEENLKRVDLEWKDEVRATTRIHELYKALDPSWTQGQTARAIGVHMNAISEMLIVHAHLHEERIASQPSCRSAYNAINRVNARRQDTAITNLMEETAVAFVQMPSVEPNPEPPPVPTLPDFTPPIAQGNFLEWAPAYDGPKFNFIHCDFPYGIGVFRPGGHIGPGGQAQVEYSDTEADYWTLVDCLMENLDRLLSHSAHLLFWFSMQHYEKTRRALHHKRLTVLPQPLIWLRSDNAGVAPDPKRGPRQVYETALLCYRGDRSIVKIVSNGHHGASDKRLHPSAKPEPMLKHFFGMLVDGTTRLLDPTAGSGTAILAAEALGAEFTQGLELNPEHVENANDAVRRARILRFASKSMAAQ